MQDILLLMPFWLFTFSLRWNTSILMGVVSSRMDPSTCTERECSITALGPVPTKSIYCAFYTMLWSSGLTALNKVCKNTLIVHLYFHFQLLNCSPFGTLLSLWMWLFSQRPIKIKKEVGLINTISLKQAFEMHHPDLTLIQYQLVVLSQLHNEGM